LSERNTQLVDTFVESQTDMSAQLTTALAAQADSEARVIAVEAEHATLQRKYETAFAKLRWIADKQAARRVISERQKFLAETAGIFDRRGAKGSPHGHGGSHYGNGNGNGGHNCNGNDSNNDGNGVANDCNTDGVGGDDGRGGGGAHVMQTAPRRGGGRVQAVRFFRPTRTSKFFCVLFIISLLF
jgi:hypothetical protein